jgi:sugar (pentulose or hexulose) kinase
MVGGGAQSRLWAAIRADVTGKPVVVPTVTEATCMGSALLVYVGAGVYSSYDKAAKRCIQQETTIKPDSIRSKEYQRRFPLYMKLHSDLTQSFRTLAQLRS